MSAYMIQDLHLSAELACPGVWAEMEENMEKNKKYIPLIVGAVVTIAGIIADVITYEAGNYKNAPYAYSLIATFAGITIIIAGLITAFKKEQSRNITNTTVLAQAALCAALSYVGCTYFKIQIPVAGTEGTMFHFGNVFCVLAALLIGGFWRGMAGAVGMSISDILSGIYITTAPKTFVLKLCIGLITGFVAHKLFRISKPNDKGHGYTVAATVVSAAAGMIFNIIAEPFVGYFYKTYLYGLPQDLAKTLAKINGLTTTVNAVVAVVAASIIYLALRPVMRKAGLLREID